MAGKTSVDLSLPKARKVRGYTIERMPIGRFLAAARRLDEVPGQVLRRLFPGAEDAVRALASLDRAGLIGLCARALTVLPDEAVRVFAELAGLDEFAILTGPMTGEEFDRAAGQLGGLRRAIRAQV